MCDCDPSRTLRAQLVPTRCAMGVSEKLSATSRKDNNTQDPSNRGVDKHRLAQRSAVRQPDCPWRSCTACKRCHISLAVSHQRHEHYLLQRHSLRPNQYPRQLLRLLPYFPTLIRSQHPRERPGRSQRQRYQLKPDWPPRQGIGTLSPAALKTDRIDRLSGKPHKTSRYRAWPRTTERLDHYKRTLHRRKKQRSATPDREIF
jgi:hypothetical protein